MTAPLVLVTTLPITTRAQARAIARLSSYRWAVETAFETMHAWGQERFLVRSWPAIARLLWVLAVACALLVLALHAPRLRALRAQAVALLKQQSVLGPHLTLGKLAEALRLDYAHHVRAWTSGWLL
jgi:Transposase DDE domain